MEKNLDKNMEIIEKKDIFEKYFRKIIQYCNMKIIHFWNELNCKCFTGHNTIIIDYLNDVETFEAELDYKIVLKNMKRFFRIIYLKKLHLINIDH